MGEAFLPFAEPVSPPDEAGVNDCQYRCVTSGSVTNSTARTIVLISLIPAGLQRIGIGPRLLI